MRWTFHIFTHNKDEFTTNIEDALSTYRRFIDDHGCARLYLQFYFEDEGDPYLEDCLLSEGEYPE